MSLLQKGFPLIDRDVCGGVQDGHILVEHVLASLINDRKEHLHMCSEWGLHVTSRSNFSWKVNALLLEDCTHV